MNQNSTILKARLNLIKNVLILLPREPFFKMVFVVFFILGLLGGSFFLFLKSFEFLDSLGGVGLIVVNRLFYLFFMGLFFMLIFSNIVISYASVFRSDEVRFLLQYPISYSKVFLLKFFESMGLSSWAFFFIIGPFLFAFGVRGNLGFDFYLASLLFFLPLIFLATLIGTAIVMLLLRFFSRRRLFIYAIFGIIVLFFLFLKYPSMSPSEYERTSFFLRRLAPYVGFSHNPFLPNYWVAEGIMATTQGRINQAVFWWMLLFSNVCMGTLVIHTLAKKIYYPLWEKIQSPESIRVYSRSPVDKIVNRLKFFSTSTRTMVGKDIKLFCRDPVQWSQFLIFFGILGIYFGNLQGLSYHLYRLVWKELISFLNIFATCLILASLTVRFIYPQLSLEGRSFWILGLAPIKFEKIIWQKFWVNLLFCLFITSGLITLSNWMLKVPPLTWIVSLVLVGLSCFSLVGLSCGLGAIFADFKIKNPAAIFSGFGGTLNFVLNLIYLLLTVGVVGGIFHQYLAGKIGRFSILKKYLIIAGAGAIILSIIYCIVPLYLGTKALKTKEY